MVLEIISSLPLFQATVKCLDMFGIRATLGLILCHVEPVATQQMHNTIIGVRMWKDYILKIGFE